MKSVETGRAGLSLKIGVLGFEPVHDMKTSVIWLAANALARVG